MRVIAVVQALSFLACLGSESRLHPPGWTGLLLIGGLLRTSKHWVVKEPGTPGKPKGDYGEVQVTSMCRFTFYM